MSQANNPFARSYSGFEIRRIVVITYDDRHPHTYQALHPSQSHLSDEQVVHHACIFSEDFVLITEDQVVPAELDALCGGSGEAQAVVYSIYGRTIDGGLSHVGDSYTLESAKAVVANLQFETGFFSRAWEISTAHITEDAGRYLSELADIATPTGLLFVAFRIPYSPAIGVKLIATPWTDENLQMVDGTTAERLREEQRKKGLHESLVDVLHLAALADVRFLVFDADAPVLEGLILYED